MKISEDRKILILYKNEDFYYKVLIKEEGLNGKAFKALYRSTVAFIFDKKGGKFLGYRKNRYGIAPYTLKSFIFIRKDYRIL